MSWLYVCMCVCVYVCVCIYIYIYIYIYTHTLNSAAMNTGVHMSLSIQVSSVCMPSSGISGSYWKESYDQPR